MAPVEIEPGIGAGVLSPGAARRRAQAGASHLPVPAPDLADLEAVGRWRAAVHAAWGEQLPHEPPHRRTSVAGVPCLEAGPAPGASGRAPAVVYAHGGGYVLGSAAVAAPITARLARHGRVVSVDYRLAPEHPFPAGLDDVTAVAAELARRGPVALVGDSAGGGIALAAALRLAARGSAPVAVVLLCPHLRHDATEPFSRAYLGPCPADDPGASPLLAALGGLPPLLVQVAAHEALAPQAVALARRARRAGVAVSLDVWDGLWHTWHYHLDVPEAGLALDEAASFVLAHAG